jgi:D-glycero-D-manno-heptose 1,7-bisphosphate phosphatase
MGSGCGVGMRRAVFLDRDGVLNRNVWNPATNQYESPLRPEQFALLPDVIPALQLLSHAGYLLFLVSNQPNFAKGKTSLHALDVIHRKLETTLTDAQIILAASYYCYHHPDVTGKCICRKPSPYFLWKARDEFGIHLAESWMIGDRVTDIQCGRAAAARTIRITNTPSAEKEADHAAPDLWSAAQIIAGTLSG